MVTVSAAVRDAVPRRLAGAVADLACGPARTTAGGRCSGSSSRSLLLLFVFVWLRGTLPRLRYDQFMRLGWKVLLPVNLVWILALAGVQVAAGRATSTGAPGCWSSAASWSLVLLVALLWPAGKEPDAAAVGRAGRPRGRPAASRCRRWTCRCRRARGPGAWWPSAQPANVGAAAPTMTPTPTPTTKEV